MNLRFMMTGLFLATSISAMAADSGDEYFNALDKIKKAPANSTPILAVDEEEKKRIFELMKKNNVDAFQMIEEINMYKGDFSNQGATEYAVISTGGSMHANTVTVYKLAGNVLTNANLSQAVKKNIRGSFYLHVSDPFAVTENGKTYLRFMAYPTGRNYDKTKLRLCTYLWQGNQFSLAEPNWKFTRANNDLVPAKDCMGAK